MKIKYSLFFNKKNRVTEERKKRTQKKGRRGKNLRGIFLEKTSFPGKTPMPFFPSSLSMLLAQKG